MLLLLTTALFAFPDADVEGVGGDPPIALTGNTQLADAAATNGWPGTGTASDPFIIEGYDIALLSGSAISLTTTTSYVVIRNNDITGLGGLVYGIQLAGAHNVRIEDNRLSGASLGVFVNTAHDAVVRGNEILGGAYGIAVLSAKRTLIDANTLHGAQHGIAAIQSEATTVRGNTLTGATIKAVYLHNSQTALIESNTIEANASPAVHVLSTPGVTGRDNTVRGHGTGVLSENAGTWTGNRFEGNTQGIVLKANGHTLAGNTFTGNGYGVYTQSSAHTFAGNLYTANVRGLYLLGAHDSTFTDETTRGNTYGVHGFNALHNTFTRIDAADDQTGIFMEVSRGTRILDGTFDNHTVAVHLSGVREAVIEGNRITNSTEALRATTGRENILRHNILAQNDKGVRLLGSTENLVYDNLFDNTANVEVTGQVTNTWSIEPTPGPNIIGGAFLGGNWWNDYEGFDLDDDGLGDIPHGPVPYGNPQFQNLANLIGATYGPEDRHPLVTAPLLLLPTDG